MRAVIYEADWQLIRINCLMSRHPEGGWSTMPGVRSNLDMLWRYLYEAKNDKVELQVRQYRVNNALNAVVMGYNGQGADKELIKRVQLFRAEHAHTGSYDPLVIRFAAGSWSWPAQVAKLRIWNEEDLWFLLDNLKRRAAKGSERTRPELHKFIGCIKMALP